MKVMKFGGGCLKNEDKLREAGRIVAASPNRVVVVVSAIDGVTDMLIQGIKDACASEKNVRDVIGKITSIHRKIIDKVINNPEDKRRTQAALVSLIGKLERLLFGVSFLGEITDSVRASVLSFGERFCSIIFAARLQEMGINAAPVQSDEIGLLTDNLYENATANLNAARKNLPKFLLPLLDNQIVPVITGYFGCTCEGKVSTFGRNGSDYSAAVIAFALGASELVIWKDVEGFMSADPGLVSDPVKLTCLSYYEAAELSYFGARILHPRTVEPLLKGRIQVSFKSIRNPAASGTRLVHENCNSPNIVKSVTCNIKISAIRILGPGVGYKPGIIAEIGQTLSTEKINIYSIITSQTSINLLLDQQDAERAARALFSIVGGVIEKVEQQDDIALIAVVGSGIKKQKGIAARVFSAVAQAGINVEMISSGASEAAYYFVVSLGDVGPAIRSVHAEFFRCKPA